jgi:hypothetical protein
MATQFDPTRYYLGSGLGVGRFNQPYRPTIHDVLARMNRPEITGMPGQGVYIDQMSTPQYVSRSGPDIFFQKRRDPMGANLYPNAPGMGFTPSAGLMDMGGEMQLLPSQLEDVLQTPNQRGSQPGGSMMPTARNVVVEDIVAQDNPNYRAEPAPEAAPQRTLGLLGDMFGGASALDEYMTPEQRAQLQNQGVMAAAMQLLAASGPSRTPVGLGQALGEAYGAGQKGYTAAQQNMFTSMAAKQKMDEAKATKNMQANVSTFLAQKAPEGVDAKEFKAQQYMRLADVYAARNPEQASKFFDMAQKLMPVRAKVSGPPMEVTGADGKPILVQQNEYGDLTTLEGFGPKRKVVLQNVDGVLTAINESALTGGEKFGTGISPVDAARISAENQRIANEGIRLGYDAQRIAMEQRKFMELELPRLGLDQQAAENAKQKLVIELQNLGIARQRLNLSQQEFQRGSYDRVQNEDGVFYVPKVPGLPVIPIAGPGGVPLKGAAGGKATEAEQNAAGFAQRMERVTQIIDALPVAAAPGMGSAIAGAIPLVGGVAQRGVQSEQTQQFQQAANDWIRAKLRKESGAAIGKDEMDAEFRTYFPQINDGPAVIAQKAEARRVATEAMKTAAGKSYRPYVPTAAPPAAGGAPVLTWDPVARKFK